MGMSALEVSTRGGCLPGGVHLPPPPVDRMTDACENITFPQLLLRMVTTVHPDSAHANTCISRVADMDTKDRIEIRETLWDQRTFLGRLRHFFWLTDYRTVIVPTKRLYEARDLLEKYE